jgi:transposase
VKADNEVMSAPDGSADILSEDQVAARYQVSPRTVRRWRYKRTGPAYFYAGRHVRYRLADLLTWEQQRAAADTRSRGPLRD